MLPPVYDGRNSGPCIDPLLAEQIGIQTFVKRTMIEHFFTLDEANALVPWLDDKLAGMIPGRDQLAAQQERLLELLRRRGNNGHSSSEEDILECRREVDRRTQQLQESLKEITDRGILVRDLGRGLVDFPSSREGREVYLCWLRGEGHIEFWHEINVGFAGRQPL